MKKEAISVAFVKKDMHNFAYVVTRHRTKRWSSYVFLILISSIVAGFVFRIFLLSSVSLLVVSLLVIRSLNDQSEYTARAKEIYDAIEREEFAVCVKKLSHIAEEKEYEMNFSPDDVGRYYCFCGGIRWKMHWQFEKYYDWSKEYCLSVTGLTNISLPNDEFYYVSLQRHHEVAFIYPCKFFELDETLRQKCEEKPESEN